MNESTNAKTVYLAGKVTGETYAWITFNKAAEELKKAGYIVLNPTVLPPQGLTYDAYMRISSAMMDECEEVCFLPSWTDSNGAMYEFGRATAKGMPYFFYDEWLVDRQAQPQATIKDK